MLERRHAWLAGVLLCCAGATAAQHRVQVCGRIHGLLVCEETVSEPSSYHGDADWCVYVPRQLGNTAQCGYASRRACEDARFTGKGYCLPNPRAGDEAGEREAR